MTARPRGCRWSWGRGRWYGVRCGSCRVSHAVHNRRRRSRGPGRLEVDVVPAQAEDLVAAHAGGGQQPERGEQPMPCGGVQERLELIGCPGLRFEPGDRAQPGCVGDERDVAGDDAVADGVGEGAADDQMHLGHGLGCQCSASVGRMQLRVVQRLQVVWGAAVGSGHVRASARCGGRPCAGSHPTWSPQRSAACRAANGP